MYLVITIEVAFSGCASLPVGLRRTRAALRWQDIDYSAINGANYVPTYAYNDVVIWDRFNPRVIDRELGYAERAGVNSIRVFMQIIVYEKDPECYLERFEMFLKLCDKHGITMMPVLFDSCFGAEPDFENRGWVANPGNSRVAQDSWPGCERYVRDVVGRHIGDRRIIMWDIMNEPMVAGTFTHTEEGREKVWRFVRHFIEFVNELDPTHATTVGVASTLCFEKVADLERVISFHSYFDGEEIHRKDITTAKEWSEKLGGKPINISEMGHYGLNQRLDMAIGVCREENIGFYFWELMIGRDPFPQVQGVFYPDGTIRYPEDFCAVLGVDVKHFMKGVFVKRGMPEEEMRSSLAEALATRTREWNLQRRMELMHSATLAEKLTEAMLREEHPEITVEEIRRRAQHGDPELLEHYHRTRAGVIGNLTGRLGNDVRSPYNAGRRDEAYANLDVIIKEIAGKIQMGGGAE